MMSAAMPTNAGETVAAWMRFDARGTVTVSTGKVELGTGVRTALAQIVAEELDLPLERVMFVMGDTGRTPDEGGTAGSKTLQTSGPRLRQIAAEARRAMLARAALRLDVPPELLAVVDGTVRVADRPARCLTFADLAGPDEEPLDIPVDGGAPTKAVEQYGVIGRSAPRVDLLAKLTGGAAFIHDLRVPGMLHGRVIRPMLRTPRGVGGSVVIAVDDASLRDLPGIVAVVRNASFVGVVAEREEQAIRAAEALRVIWSPPEPLPDRHRLFDDLDTVPVDTVEVARIGDVDAALAGATRTLTATYAFPAQAHGSLGPSCAVADVGPDEATVYASSQSVFGLRASLAPLLGLDAARIRVIHLEGSGCYGHNGADDVGADAALLSQAVGRPVRVQWMRMEEFAWEPKSPAMFSRVCGGVNDAGDVVAWAYDVWTPAHTSRPNGEPGRLLAAELVDPPFTFDPPARGGGDRNAAHTYAFPHSRVTAHWLRTSPLRSGSLRSLGGMANTTAIESFVDELATLSGTDPVEFRLRHLHDPRAIAVVRRAAEAAGWEARPGGARADRTVPPRPGSLLHGRGIAFAQYESRYAYVAMVAEVEVNPVSGTVRVTRVTVAHDCGLIVNPDGVANQIEGNVIQGISRALKEEVAFNQLEVTSLTYETYPILTFTEVPEIHIELIDRPSEPSLGAGEPAICPVAAAVANSIFDATGARLRAVPYTPERVREALASVATMT